MEPNFCFGDPSDASSGALDISGVTAITVSSEEEDDNSFSSVMRSEETRNQFRCQQILECKEQIEYWTKKLERLQQEQNKRIKLARLRIDANEHWDSLSEDEYTDKEYILAALESERIPEDLNDFSMVVFPSSIRKDRDIFLARVARDDFESRYEDDRLFVPPNLRGDKEVILKILPKHAAVVESMSWKVRDDDDIFLALLSNARLQHNVLQHFSQRIRSSATLMLKLSSHYDGIHSFNFIHSSLRNDKDFMLKAIAMHHAPDSSSLNVVDPVVDLPLILRYASQRLQDDFDVVYAAVQKCGMNLKYASYDMRRNRTIVVAATERHPIAFRYCLPGNTKDGLLGDRSFVRSSLAKRCPNELLRINKTCFDDMAINREDLGLMLEGGLDWVHVPIDWQNNKDFVLEAVVKNPKLFMDIAEGFREDPDIVRAVIRSQDVDDNVLLEATEKCPELLSDRDAMLTIVKAWWTDVLHETLRYSPVHIREDKELMLEAVKNDPRMYEFVGDDLARDLDVVLTVVNTAPILLHLVDMDFQRDHPEVVVAAITNAEKHDLDTLSDEIPQELWSNYDVVLAWLERGGEWHEDIDQDFETDETLLLALVLGDWEGFWTIDAEPFRSDKSFMQKAISMESRLIDDAEGGLRHDYDLALTAFSQSHLPVSYFFEDGDDFHVLVSENDEDYGGEGAKFFSDFQFLVSFVKTIREKIAQYDAYQDIVVDNITNPSSPPNSTLFILNQGLETSNCHAQLISSFLGLPQEEEVAKLRQASANLLLWGL